MSNWIRRDAIQAFSTVSYDEQLQFIKNKREVAISLNRRSSCKHSFSNLSYSDTYWCEFFLSRLKLL
jgi:hypothetical protein